MKKQIKSPNLKKIFNVKHVNQIPDSEFLHIVANVDNKLSSIAKYVGQYYENGEQTIFYKRGPWNITVTITDNND
jgi:hypothetical protein